jgi:hypothetical protein
VHGLERPDAAPAGPGQHGKHRAGSAAGRRATQPRPGPGEDASPADIFNRFAADYIAERPGRTITLLQAGCTTVGPELDVAALRTSAPDLVVSRVDADDGTVRAIVAASPDLAAAVLTELKTLALAPRSVDFVQCTMLLHRIGNAELVLDRLVAALRPGGLLFLRTADRETAAGLLDRKLPQRAREAAWRATWPGQPGPFPAYYEPIASGRGIEAFVVRHGLAIAHRQACSGGVRPGVGSWNSASERLVTWLSRGRLVDGYDELRYVIRKPEDRYARILSP